MISTKEQKLLLSNLLPQQLAARHSEQAPKVFQVNTVFTQTETATTCTLQSFAYVHSQEKNHGVCIPADGFYYPHFVHTMYLETA